MPPQRIFSAISFLPGFSFVFLSWIALTVWCPDAFALSVLKNQEAVKYLGDYEKHFLATPYAYEILGRSHRDSMHGRFSDGIIFNADGGMFQYLTRKDGEHLVVLNSPKGRQEDSVTAEDWRKKISNNLSDDNRNPYVFLDDSGKEIAVVFIGNGAKVDGKMTGEGLLEIAISVEGARETRGRRRMTM